MFIASLGIDLGKTTFHLVALGKRSKVLIRKKFSRAQLLAYTQLAVDISDRGIVLAGGGALLKSFVHHMWCSI
jgi:hypothetical protein